MDTGAWRAAVRGVLKESDVTEEDLAHRRYTEHFSQLKKKKKARHVLNEEGMATHCSILACRISGTEDPGGLRFLELQSIARD